jgi:hypothetical protein
VRTRTTAIAALFAALPALTLISPDAAWAQAPAAAPAGPSPQDVSEAKARFEKGSGLFKSGKYAQAMEEFRASYGRVASPNSHLYIARCLMNLGQTVDAYLEYDKVAAEAQTAGEKYAQTGETAKTERDELAPKLALVTVDVTTREPGAKLTVGGKEVPEDHWGKPFPAAPGAVEVSLQAPSKAPATQSVNVAAGQSQSVTIGFTSATTSPVEGGTSSSGGGMNGMRVGAFVAGGVGVAGLVTFAVAGSMSNATYKDLQNACGNGPCPQSRADDVSRGKTQQTLANVGLVVGAVGVAAGATLFVLSLRGGKKAEATGKTELVVGPTYLGARGTF